MRRCLGDSAKRQIQFSIWHNSRRMKWASTVSLSVCEGWTLARWRIARGGSATATYIDPRTSSFNGFVENLTLTYLDFCTDIWCSAPSIGGAVVSSFTIWKSSLGPGLGFFWGLLGLPWINFSSWHAHQRRHLSSCVYGFFKIVFYSLIDLILIEITFKKIKWIN